MPKPALCDVCHKHSGRYAKMRLPIVTTLVRGEWEYTSPSKGKSTLVFGLCEGCFEKLKPLNARRRLVAVGLLSGNEIKT